MVERVVFCQYSALIGWQLCCWYFHGKDECCCCVTTLKKSLRFHWSIQFHKTFTAKTSTNINWMDWKVDGDGNVKLLSACGWHHLFSCVYAVCVCVFVCALCVCAKTWCVYVWVHGESGCVCMATMLCLCLCVHNSFSWANITAYRVASGLCVSLLRRYRNMFYTTVVGQFVRTSFNYLWYGYGYYIMVTTACRIRSCCLNSRWDMFSCVTVSDYRLLFLLRILIGCSAIILVRSAFVNTTLLVHSCYGVVLSPHICHQGGGAGEGSLRFLLWELSSQGVHVCL